MKQAVLNVVSLYESNFAVADSGVGGGARGPCLPTAL